VRIGPVLGDQAAVPAEDCFGVTSRCWRSHAGRVRIRADRMARSGQVSRGLGLVRRSTATSWRRTSSSTSLVALLRARSTSQPTNRAKIRYSRRSSTHHADPTGLRCVHPSLCSATGSRQRPSSTTTTPI
jgi:hypothetical protein